MKKIIFTLTYFLILKVAFCQTYVGGGIYSNTTWTLVNSPYIVTDTVVVFPGVTLTLEPGVVVKFDDDLYLEIRNATLVAEGNSSDSITFTSNSLTPAAGIWGGIRLNNSAASFNFVNVKYASKGIDGFYSQISFIKNSAFIYNLFGLYTIDNSSIDSCIFKFNSTGLHYLPSCSLNYCTISNNTSGIEDAFAGTQINNCSIDSNQTGSDVSNATYLNCTISYNQTGIDGPNNTLKYCIIENNSICGLNLAGGGHNTDSVINCAVKFNGIGITSSTCGGGIVPDGLITQCDIESNTIGLQLGGCCDVFCNSFCSNSSYDLQNLNSSPKSVPNNYWCTSDSATVEVYIYDGYDNTNLGLVTFMPMDSLLQCSPLITSSINEYPEENMFQIFPNPTTGTFTILNIPSNQSSLLQIINSLGEITGSEKLFGRKEWVVHSTLSSGIYLVRMLVGERIIVRKLIIE